MEINLYIYRIILKFLSTILLHFKKIFLFSYKNVPVAQLDRVSGREPDGWKFKSSRVHHLN